MTKSINQWPRGAEWRRWDLHVHTPASQLGNSFVGVSWIDYVNELEAAAVRHSIAVIYSFFERKNGFKISYLAGSIENPALNAHVVNVLEGTKPAFENRRVKYH